MNARYEEYYKPKDGYTSDACFSECRIPYSEKRIPQAQDRSDHRFVWFFQEEGFSTFSINVSVCAEKGCKCSHLIPPNKHL